MTDAVAEYNREVEQLAAMAVLAAAAIQQSEEPQEAQQPQLVALVLKAIMQARSIACWWANVRHGGTRYEPALITPEKHGQVEAGISTALEAGGGVLATVVRNETVRAGAQQFTDTATEVFLAELDEILTDDDQSDDDTEDPHIVWEVINDGNPCPKCVAVRGQVYEDSNDFNGVHPNCGCFLAPTYRKVDR